MALQMNGFQIAQQKNDTDKGNNKQNSTQLPVINQIHTVQAMYSIFAVSMRAEM